MTQLRDIIKNLRILHRQGSEDLAVNALCFDSRRVEKGDVFFAVRGSRVDGHRFIEQAIGRGARVIVHEDRAVSTQDENVTFLTVANVNAALGIAASNFYGVPSRALHLVGVTGTNGKTTIATSLFQLFRRLGHGVGLLSTIENRINGQIIAATHTTPDAMAINRLLRKMVDAGCEYCFMEVSSHALAQYRTAGLAFAGGIFSNLSQDHLDYHGTFQDYRTAKKSFFDALAPHAFALANADDPSSGRMLDDCGARRFYYGIEGPEPEPKDERAASRPSPDYACHILESGFHGMRLDMDGTEIHTHRIGRFNAANLLAVHACAVLLGQSKEDVLAAMGESGHGGGGGLGRIAGRFESIRSDRGVTAIIDYAHTPDALKNVLETIDQIRSGHEQVITVVGAGGDRDRTKRPLMAGIAANLSDRLVLTSDNPRSEDPARIIEDMQSGVEREDREKVTAVLDRRQAIAAALNLATPGDIVLVAGKGHETYQEVKGVRRHFDDREVVTEIFREGKLSEENDS